MTSTPSAAPAVQLFDPTRLELGDIVLERGTGPSSDLTAWSTGGEFTHALIWVGDDFLEAMPDGVRSLSYYRVPVLDAAKWRLLRLAADSHGAGAQAAVNARNLAFKDYDLWGAMRTVLGPRQEPIPEKLFCSQLVARAYLDAKVSLVPGKAPEGVTPGDLALHAKGLKTVDLPLQPGHGPGGEPYPDGLLDRSKAYQASPMAKERKINRELVLAVRDRFEKLTPPDGHPPPGNLVELLILLPHFERAAALDIAGILLDRMNQTGYFRMLPGAMAPLWFGDAPLPHDYARAIAHHRQNAEACHANDSLMPHAIWQQLRAMYVMNALALEALVERNGGS